MAVITISIDDSMNDEFRKFVEKKLGKGKGILKKAVMEAIRKWIEEEEQKQIAERQIKLMKEGVISLKGWKFNREEIHER